MRDWKDGDGEVSRMCDGRTRRNPQCGVMSRGVGVGQFTVEPNSALQMCVGTPHSYLTGDGPIFDRLVAAENTAAIVSGIGTCFFYKLKRSAAPSQPMLFLFPLAW